VQQPRRDENACPADRRQGPRTSDQPKRPGDRAEVDQGGAPAEEHDVLDHGKQSHRGQRAQQSRHCSGHDQERHGNGIRHSYPQTIRRGPHRCHEQAEKEDDVNG